MPDYGPAETEEGLIVMACLPGYTMEAGEEFLARLRSGEIAPDEAEAAIDVAVNLAAPVATGFMRVSADRLNLREGPGINWRITGELVLGQRVEAWGWCDTWRLVRAGGKIGWVAGEWLDPA